MKESRESNEEPLGESPAGKAAQGNPPLPSLGILGGLSEQSLADMATYGVYKQFSAGTEIIHEGDAQNCFYIVVAGKLEISARDVPLSMAEAGECIGEVSLFDPGPASASVRVVEDATLWSMSIGELHIYLAEHVGGAGALLMGMASCLSRRLREANLLIRQHHVLPVETLPKGGERAITADNTPVQVGFFDRLTQSLGSIKRDKVRISTKIKM